MSLIRPALRRPPRGHRLLGPLTAVLLAIGALALTPSAAHADDPVIIATQPADAAVAEGAPVTFTVTFAPGTFTLGLQWYRDTTDNGVQDGTLISGATKNSYTLTPAKADDGVRFYLRFQALVNGKVPTYYSDSALLSVGTDPVTIVTQPGDTSVQAYQRASLSVVVDGSNPLTYQWQRRQDGGDWTDVAGAITPTYSFKTAPGDDQAQYHVIVDNPYGDPVTSDPATLTVRPPSGTATPVSDASLEWGLNPIYQGGNPAGISCNFFSAGLGTDFSGQAGDVQIVHVGPGGPGSPDVDVTDASKCLSDDGSANMDQRVLFTHGTGTANPVTGEATISWQGSFTANAYGGLLPWHLSDPRLTVNLDGTGTLTATAGGQGATRDDPTTQHPVKDRVVTVATFPEVRLTDHGVEITPDFAGVDYFPLNPDGTRSTTSAIPGTVKAGNPGWGSWPESFVDFQYETGLSSYWHSSGLDDDGDKPPFDIAVRYDSAPTVLQLPDVVSNPQASAALPLINGRSESVSATVAGADQLQWQRQQGSGSASTWTDIDGATGATLALAPVDSSWNGATIRLLATNAQGSRATATLTLSTADYQAPTFTKQPGGTDVIANTPLTVSFAATGTPALDPSKVRLERSDDGDATWTATDATFSGSSSVALDSVPESWDGDDFRIVVANTEDTTATSATFQLTVHPDLDHPQLLVLPRTALDPAQGGTLTVLGAGFAIPDPESSTASYSLDVGLFDTTAFHPGDGSDPRSSWIATSSDSSSGQLYQGSLTRSRGSFRITVKVPAGALTSGESYGVGTFLRLTDTAGNSNTFANRTGDTWTPIAVGNQTAPRFVHGPADVTATAPATGATGRATFTVKAAGTPAPTLTWQTRDTDGAWQDLTQTGPSLDLPYQAGDDGLQVRAIATGAGVAVSAPATLRLSSRSSAVSLTGSADHQAYAADEGHRVTLSATVQDGSGPASSGQVRFQDGAQVLGTVPVTSDGTAQLRLPADLARGIHQIVATFLPDPGATTTDADSAAYRVQVTRAAAQLRLTVRPRHHGHRLVVRLHAQAPGAQGLVPAGRVTVRLHRPGGRTTTRTVTLQHGSAVLRMAAPARGRYTVNARLARSDLTRAATTMPAKLRLP